MVRRIANRLGMGVGLVFAVVTVTFLLINLAPGDPARLWASPGASASELESVRRSLGLDQPILVRYAVWIGR